MLAKNVTKLKTIFFTNICPRKLFNAAHLSCYKIYSIEFMNKVTNNLKIYCFMK